MYTRQKPLGIEEKMKVYRLQKQLAGNRKKLINRKIFENNPLKTQIVELEKEIARLHSTVKFFQDMCLLDD